MILQVVLIAEKTGTCRATAPTLVLEAVVEEEEEESVCSPFFFQDYVLSTTCMKLCT